MPRDLPSDAKFVEWSNARTAWESGTLTSIGVINVIARGRPQPISGLDVGGGTGKFAAILQTHCDCTIDVVDPSITAARNFVDGSHISYFNTTFEEFAPDKKYDFIFFNLVLHQIIAEQYDESATLASQSQALKKARSLLKDKGILIIQENFYQGLIGHDTAGQLIYKLTSMKSIQKITKKLGANTAGEGVRFRSLQGWKAILKESGFSDISISICPDWSSGASAWKKLALLIKRTQQGVIVAAKSDS